MVTLFLTQVQNQLRGRQKGQVYCGRPLYISPQRTHKYDPPTLTSDLVTWLALNVVYMNDLIHTICRSRSTKLSPSVHIIMRKNKFVFYSPKFGAGLLYVHACSVAQLYLILCNPMNCSPPCCSVLGISQARILEWVAISFSRESPQPRAGTRISGIGSSEESQWVLHHEPPEKPGFLYSKKSLKH